MLITVLSCKTSNQPTKIIETSIEIAHYKVPCIGNQSAVFCYLIRKIDNNQKGNWEYFYGDIKGFNNYQWGHQYEIKVKQIIQDTTREALDVTELYEFSEILNDRPLPLDTFTLMLKMDEYNNYIIQELDSSFTILGEMSFRITNSLSINFKDRLLNSSSLEGKFTYQEKENPSLLLHQIDSIK